MHKLYNIIIFQIMLNAVCGWRILCICDSITQGHVHQYSHRRPLQQMLNNSRIKFDFVGSQRKPWGSDLKSI